MAAQGTEDDDDGGRESGERGLRKKGGRTHRRRIRRRKEAPRRNIKSPLPRGRMASYDGGANVFLRSRRSYK